MQPFDPPDPTTIVEAPTGAVWQRRHPVSPVINGIDSVRRLWPFLLLAFVRGPGFYIPAVAVGGSAILGWAVVAHLRFQYRIDGSELVVRSGVLVHRTRTLPADRVQQVGVEQKLRHRVFGVVDVGVELAGAGSEPEVHLSVVTEAEAERIRSVLADVRWSADDVAPTEPASTSQPSVVYRQPNGSLVRWAVANSPFLVAAILAPSYGVFDDVGGDSVVDRVPSGPFAVLVVVAIAALVALVVAISVNVMRYHDMTLEQSGDELRLRYGLLTRRRVDVPRERVQVLAETITLPGRLAGVVGVRAHNASSARDETTAYFPAVPSHDVATLHDLLLPGLDAQPVGLVRHPRAALRRAIIRRAWPITAVASVLIVWIREPWSLLFALALVPAGVFGWRAWNVLGHALTTDAIVARRGVWGETTSFVRLDRVQSASVEATWFQRRLGLANLRVDVAQPLGNVELVDLAAPDADRLLRDIIRVRAQRPSSTMRDERTCRGGSCDER